MCLFIKSGCKIEIAEKPIPIIKLVDVKGDHKFLWIKYWISYYRHTLHRYNRTIKAVRHLKAKKLGIIDEGFHAFIQDPDYGPDPIVGDGYRYAVIPKGAEYCLGFRNEIVANKIIIFSSWEKFNKYVSNNQK